MVSYDRNNNFIVLGLYEVIIKMGAFEQTTQKHIINLNGRDYKS
jgi:hypothetical protein